MSAWEQLRAVADVMARFELGDDPQGALDRVRAVLDDLPAELEAAQERQWTVAVTYAPGNRDVRAGLDAEQVETAIRAFGSDLVGLAGRGVRKLEAWVSA